MKRRRNKHFSLLITVLIIVAAALLMPRGSDTNDRPVQTAADGELRVHFIDVGQGDSTFIQLPDGKTMLIDAGEKEYGETVSSYISDCGADYIDYVVCTHPHTDHIGGMQTVIESSGVGDIYMPYADSSSSVYERLLEAIDEKGCEITTVWAGDTLAACSEYTITAVAPMREYASVNNSSIVLKLTYGGTSFLFAGDAEQESEKDIVGDISADVVKVGHHGSDSSSCASFVQRTGADFAVISVGADNAYGHPSDSVVARWMSAGARILRTDTDGTVVFASDGKTVSYIR